MEAPGITRRRRPRRPFLAPVWVVALMVLAAFGLALLLVHFMGTTVVVVVHAPPDATGDGDDVPALSTQGQQRAQSLAVMFGDAGVQGSLDALYVSESRSARQTLAPLAGRLGAQPVPIPGANPARAAARMMHEHSGGRVLLVASSEQVPALVRALSGTEVPQAPEDAGYILSIPTIGQASLVRFRY